MDDNLEVYESEGQNNNDNPEREARMHAIETELYAEVKKSNQSWIRTYMLMNEVEADKLWQTSNLKSFTSWVNAFAKKAGVHVSSLWTRLKAGRVLAEYEARASEQGRAVPNLLDIATSPESINLCESVAGANARAMDHLIDKVLKNELTRADLRQAANAKRAAGGQTPKNGHDRIDSAKRTATEPEVTAADIVLALQRGDWLDKAECRVHDPVVFRLFEQFRADSGTTHHARLMDALIAETMTRPEWNHIVLRGIEIKISKSDLLSDKKMSEYTEYCDYFYIAIPADDEDLLEAVDMVRLPDWGVITVSVDGVVTVVHEPKQQNPMFRDWTLANCIIKLIK